jgi:hypothetical protein
MRLAATLVVLGTTLTASAHGKPAPGQHPAHGAVSGSHGGMPGPHSFARPAPPLPMLPSVARVRVEAARDRVVLLEDVTLPRGDWQAGSLDLHVAFGAPGTPVAVDAHVLPVPIGATEPRADDPGEPVAVEATARHVASAQLLLGKGSMAGVTLHVQGTQLRRAFSLSDTVVLRIRSLLGAPAADATGGRDVVVRLGASQGQPLTLEKVQLASLEARPWITRAEAHLCGPDADPWPLTVTVTPRPSAPATATLAPAMVVRHASDDLCIRWWASP